MSEINRIPVVAVVGPTASGKTRLGAELAVKYNGEVISADSMQIYKYMDIATAKPTEDEMMGVAHHMMSFLPPSENYSVAQYVADAKRCIFDIFSRGKLPIVVGGTGLYIKSLLEDISFAEEDADYDLRDRLRERAEMYGAEVLINELAEFDPESAQRMHPNNLKRIIRAIEVYRTTGITMTEHNRLSKTEQSPYQTVKIGLKSNDRRFLYDRIDRRVDLMLEQGLIEEAKRVLDCQCSMTAQKAIGYKELIPYFNGEQTLEQCIETLKRNSRRYAKRQLTWFMRDEEIYWIDIDMAKDFEEVFCLSVSQIDDKLCK